MPGYPGRVKGKETVADCSKLMAQRISLVDNNRKERLGKLIAFAARHPRLTREAILMSRVAESWGHMDST